MIGIIGYGNYIPRYRLQLSSIAKMWEKDTMEIVGGLKVQEKSVPYYDEDIVSMSIEAGREALSMAQLHPHEIGALYIGSESHPYAVNPSSSTIGEYLEVGNSYLAADLEFACKAGTASMQLIYSLINSGQIKYGLAFGADTAQGKPHDALEYTAASAAVCFLLGDDSAKPVALIQSTSSYTSNTPDFWRRDGKKYPSHFGRFTGEPAYFQHIVEESKQLLSQSGTKPEDYDYCVFHMPNGKFPRVVAKKLGFTDAQLAPSLTVDHIGNPYSASSLLGLAAVLDTAKPNQKIFMVSYGSGAGADGFILQTTKFLQKKRTNHRTVQECIDDKIMISYEQYLRFTHTLS
ncbi:hydroxymethylglutaryl-CoA synthase [Candidatus Roizmanbacteria bacterium]|nr:hydroxymethylglutaryl-CoA synthase [Candidatus Roizmanbacteria bacterium]